jgi:hypothetical protein
MSRGDLINQILDARTPDEIAAAYTAAGVWLATNPHDVGIALACEQLAMLESAAGE